MTTPDLPGLLPAVEAIARQAGTEIMRHRDNPDIQTKDDGSHVTDADLAAEAIIVPALQALTPHIPIVSEERVASGDAPDIRGGTFWTVDPIDGTREFIEKGDGFVVAIGLVVDGGAALGLIYHPSLDILFTGIGPGTARQTTAAAAVSLPLSATQREDTPWRILFNGRGSERAPIDAWLAGRGLGAALCDDGATRLFRPCRIARGGDDINGGDINIVYCKRAEGKIAFWDVVPGHAIVEAAGGQVETFTGKPLRYDAPDFYTVPHVMVAPHRVAAFSSL